MNKEFHPTPYNGCNYLSMLRNKLTQIMCKNSGPYFTFILLLGRIVAGVDAIERQQMSEY